jgi:hypothetical protein
MTDEACHATRCCACRAQGFQYNRRQQRVCGMMALAMAQYVQQLLRQCPAQGAAPSFRQFIEAGHSNPLHCVTTCCIALQLAALHCCAALQHAPLCSVPRFSRNKLAHSAQLRRQAAMHSDDACTLDAQIDGRAQHSASAWLALRSTT